MLDEATYRLIVDASEALNLDSAIVEKDYYVTDVLNILSNVKDDHSTLVFAGGTALAKAHRVVKRMSEDVDFKFQRKIGFEHLSKNQYLKTLKNFREHIISALGNRREIKETAVRNEGQYLRVEIEYDSAFPSVPQLRPHLLLEFTSSLVTLPTQTMPITTLIQDTLGHTVPLQSCTLTCISAEETAAEKWVGLTRRIAAIDHGYYRDDKTLIRHVYDLAGISSANLLGKDFLSLVNQVIQHDAKQFKNQYPEYFVDPIKEIKLSLAILKTHPEWENRYNKFLEDMVYAAQAKPSYHDALNVIEKLSEEVIQILPDNNTIQRYALPT